MATTKWTSEAQEVMGQFVLRAGKNFLLLRCSDLFGEVRAVRVTPNDVAEFFISQARNLRSGCRTLAGLTADWRPISELAQACLNWFKQVNVAAMRRAGRKVGLEPRF